MFSEHAKALIREAREKAGKATEGPWDIWGGPEYVGGGADLCIGAGEEWLVNMDHRNCVNREAHMCGGNFPPCEREPNTNICSGGGCKCNQECLIEDHISEEQKANAEFIKASRTLVPALADLAERALVVVEAAKKVGEGMGWSAREADDPGVYDLLQALRTALKAMEDSQ